MSVSVTTTDVMSGKCNYNRYDGILKQTGYRQIYTLLSTIFRWTPTIHACMQAFIRTHARTHARSRSDAGWLAGRPACRQAGAHAHPRRHASAQARTRAGTHTHTLVYLVVVIFIVWIIYVKCFHSFLINSKLCL